MLQLEDISESSTDNLLVASASHFDCETEAANLLNNTEQKLSSNHYSTTVKEERSNCLMANYERSAASRSSPLSTASFNDAYRSYTPAQVSANQMNNGYQMEMYQNQAPDSNASIDLNANGEEAIGNESATGQSSEYYPSKEALHSSYYGAYQHSSSANVANCTIANELGTFTANYLQSSHDAFNAYGMVANQGQAGTPQVQCTEASGLEGDRKAKLRKTVNDLKRSNLYDVTMKTGELMKRNKVLRKELAKFKGEVAHFLASISLANAQC